MNIERKLIKVQSILLKIVIWIKIIYLQQINAIYRKELVKLLNDSVQTHCPGMSTTSQRISFGANLSTTIAVVGFNLVSHRETMPGFIPWQGENSDRHLTA